MFWQPIHDFLGNRFIATALAAVPLALRRQACAGPDASMGVR
jgi:hypothetical protein